MDILRDTAAPLGRSFFRLPPEIERLRAAALTPAKRGRYTFR